MAWSQNGFWPVWEAPGSSFSPTPSTTVCSLSRLGGGQYDLQGRAPALLPNSRPESELTLSSDFNQAVIAGSPSRKGFLLSPYPFSSTWTVNHFPWCLKQFSILVFMLLENSKPQPSEIYESRDHVCFAHQDPYPLVPCLAYSIYK